MDDNNEAALAEGEVLPEAEQEEAPATSADAKPEEKTEEPQRKNRRSFQKRIDQLTAELRERDRKLAEYSAPKSEPSTAPKREDFADYEEYIEAKAEFKAVQAAEKRLQEAEKDRQKQAEQAQATAAQRSFIEAKETTLERGAAKYADFEAVVTNEDLEITPVMADGILSSEKGDELWYYLGKNPDVADEIAALPPGKQLMALGKLEATLTGGKKASAAPRPTEPVEARGSTTNALSDKLSTAEWMRRRREETRKSSI